MFIDASKDWTNEGCGFFLADKLLRPGGVILFDDYNWSYRAHETATGKRFASGYVFQSMSKEEFDEPQIKAVFELLVMQHESYGELEIIDGLLAMARKVPAAGTKELLIHSRYSLKYRLVTGLKELLKG